MQCYCPVQIDKFIKSIKAYHIFIPVDNFNDNRPFFLQSYR